MYNILFKGCYFIGYRVPRKMFNIIKNWENAQKP